MQGKGIYRLIIKILYPHPWKVSKSSSNELQSNCIQINEVNTLFMNSLPVNCRVNFRFHLQMKAGMKYDNHDTD